MEQHKWSCFFNFESESTNLPWSVTKIRFCILFALSTTGRPRLSVYKSQMTDCFTREDISVCTSERICLHPCSQLIGFDDCKKPFHRRTKWCTIIENHVTIGCRTLKPSENHWSQWLPQPFHSMVMVPLIENHWKFGL